ncbi:hypothetical protein [Spirosoma agri]
MIKYFTAVLMLIITTSCNKEALPDCGCQGVTTGTLDQSLAVYKQRLPSEYLVTGLKPNDYFYTICNPSFVDGKITDGDTILVSGKAHKNCFEGESFIAQPSLLEVTAVRRK